MADDWDVAGESPTDTWGVKSEDPWGESTTTPATELGSITQMPKEFIRGAGSMVADAPAGVVAGVNAASQLAGSDMRAPAWAESGAKAWRAGVDKLLPEAPANPTIFQMAGNMAGAVTAGGLMPGGVLAKGLPFALQGMAEAQDAADKSGASPTDRSKYVAGSGVLGELAGFIPAAGKAGDAFGRQLWNSAKTGLAVNPAITVGGNVLQQQTINPNQPTLAGAGESAVTGLVGGPLGHAASEGVKRAAGALRTKPDTLSKPAQNVEQEAKAETDWTPVAETPAQEETIVDDAGVAHRMNHDTGLFEPVPPPSSHFAGVPHFDTISAAANKYGVDPTTALVSARIESNFGRDPNTMKGKNTGIFQLGEAEYDALRVPKNQRSDPSIQVDAGVQWLAKTQADLAKALGRDVIPQEIYLAHQQGVAGATALLTADPNARASDVVRRFYKTDGIANSAIEKNTFGKRDPNITAGDFIGRINDRFDNFAGGKSPIGTRAKANTERMQDWQTVPQAEPEPQQPPTMADFGPVTAPDIAPPPDPIEQAAQHGEQEANENAGVEAPVAKAPSIDLSTLPNIGDMVSVGGDDDRVGTISHMFLRRGTPHARVIDDNGAEIFNGPMSSLEAETPSTIEPIEIPPYVPPPAAHTEAAQQGVQEANENAGITAPAAKTPSIDTSQGATANATQERQQPQNDLSQHPGTREGLPEVGEDRNQQASITPQGTEASSGDRVEQGAGGLRKWTREAIAQEYARKLGSESTWDFHYQIADAILNKDAYGLLHLANSMNGKGKTLFAEVTGIDLPKTQSGTLDALLNWAGIDKETYLRGERYRLAAKETERTGKEAAKVNVPDPAGKTDGKSWIEAKIAQGYDQEGKNGIRRGLVNPRTNMFLNLSVPNGPKLRAHAEAILRMKANEPSPVETAEQPSKVEPPIGAHVEQPAKTPAPAPNGIARNAIAKQAKDKEATAKRLRDAEKPQEPTLSEPVAEQEAQKSQVESADTNITKLEGDLANLTSLRETAARKFGDANLFLRNHKKKGPLGKSGSAWKQYADEENRIFSVLQEQRSFLEDYDKKINETKRSLDDAREKNALFDYKNSEESDRVNMLLDKFPLPEGWRYHTQAGSDGDIHIMLIGTKSPSWTKLERPRDISESTIREWQSTAVRDNARMNPHEFLSSLPDSVKKAVIYSIRNKSGENKSYSSSRIDVSRMSNEDRALAMKATGTDRAFDAESYLNALADEIHKKSKTDESVAKQCGVETDAQEKSRINKEREDADTQKLRDHAIGPNDIRNYGPKSIAGLQDVAVEGDKVIGNGLMIMEKGSVPGFDAAITSVSEKGTSKDDAVQKRKNNAADHLYENTPSDGEQPIWDSARTKGKTTYVSGETPSGQQITINGVMFGFLKKHGLDVRLSKDGRVAIVNKAREKIGVLSPMREYGNTAKDIADRAIIKQSSADKGWKPFTLGPKIESNHPYHDKDVTIEMNLGIPLPKSIRDAIDDIRNVKKLPFIQDLTGFIQAVGVPFQIAALHPEFGHVAANQKARMDMRESNVKDLAAAGGDYSKSDQKTKEAVNPILEWADATDTSLRNLNVGATITNTVNRPKGEGGMMLSKYGDRFTITEPMLKAIKGFRATMDAGLALLRDTVYDRHGMTAATAPRTAWEAIQQANAHIRAGNVVEAKKYQALAYDLQRFDNFVKAHPSYIPHVRFGNYGIVVKEGGIGGIIRAFHTFEADSAFQRMMQKGEIRRAKEALDVQFPASKGFYVSEPFERTQAKTAMDNTSLSDLETILGYIGADGAFKDYAKNKYLQKIQEIGFGRHFLERKNIPGQSSDIARVLHHYTMGVTGYTAKQKFGRAIEAAIKGISAEKKPQLYQYARDYCNYIDAGQSEAQALRSATYMWALGGNVSSAVRDMFQMPNIVAPYFSMFTSHGNMAAHMTRALADVTKSIRIKNGRPHFDLDTLPADVRNEMKKGDKTDAYAAQANQEEMWLAAGHQPEFIRNLTPGLKTTLQLVSGLYTAAQRANRLATGIMTVRLAKDPAVLTKIAQVLKNDGRFKATFPDAIHANFASFTPADVAKLKIDPAELAKFMADETHFNMSKINRPEIQRGSIKSTLTQFKGFHFNNIALLYRMANMYGPEGKRAFAASMVGYAITGGALGLPFVGNIEDLVEAASKKFWHHSIDIKGSIQEFFDEMGHNPGLFGEFLLHGVTRLAGAEVGRRIGLGDPLPTSKDTGISFEDTLGPGASIFGTMAKNVVRDIRNDRPSMAAVDVLPPPFKGIAQGQRLVNEGYRTGPGTVVIPPEKISGGDIVRQSLGFQPASVARELEKREYKQTLIAQVREHNDAVKQQIQSALIEQNTAMLRRDAPGVNAANAKVGKLMEMVSQWNETHTPDQHITFPGQSAMRKMNDYAVNGRPVTAPKQLRGVFQDMRNREQE